jgi:translation initiation factor 5
MAGPVSEENPLMVNMVNSFEGNLMVTNRDSEHEGDDEQDALEVFATYLGQAKGPLSPNALLSKMEELNIKRHRGLAVYVQVIFSEGNIMELLPRQLSIIKALCKDTKCQKSLLGGVERLLGLIHTSQLPKLPIILKKFYESDMLDEETLIYWADHPSKKYVGSREVAKTVRQSAEPFIHWLKNAESEEDE